MAGIAVAQADSTWVPAFQPTLSETDWTGTVSVTATVGGGGDVTFGIQPGATGGFDAGVDGLSPPAPPAPSVDGFFFYPGNAAAEQRLQKSILADDADPLEWLMVGSFAGAGGLATQTLTIAATDANFPNMPSGHKVELLDQTKTVLQDLRVGSGSIDVTLDFFGNASVLLYILVTPGAPLPAGPVLTSPAADERIGDTTPQFTWQASGVAGVNGYRIQVATSSGDGFQTPVINEAVGNTTQFETPANLAIPADGIYYWRVRAEIAGSAATDFSAAFSFDLDLTPPAAPPLVAPLPGEAFNTRTIDLE